MVAITQSTLDMGEIAIAVMIVILLAVSAGYLGMVVLMQAMQLVQRFGRMFLALLGAFYLMHVFQGITSTSESFARGHAMWMQGIALADSWKASALRVVPASTAPDVHWSWALIQPWLSKRTG
jgi:hypothetical protein